MESLNIPPDYEPTQEEKEGSNKATRIVVGTTIASFIGLALFLVIYYGSLIVNYIKTFLGV